MQLLHLDSSVLGAASVSRQLSAEIVARHHEPPRFSRRLQLLRRWSHEQVEQVLT